MDALVVVSPHAPRRPIAFGIYAGDRTQGSLANFGAASSRVDLPAARAVATAIASEAASRGLKTWEIMSGELDHGAVVPLWFAVEAGWNKPTVVMGLDAAGQSGVANFGRAIASATAKCGASVALIASGDMSHRLARFSPGGYDPHGAAFDRWLIETIGHGDYRALCKVDAGLEWQAGEDALDSVLVAAAALDFESAGHEVLSYEGPFGVGYGVAVLFDAARATATQRMEAA
jgi:aromatic ring-opening dioxygenase LigB subunit